MPTTHRDNSIINRSIYLETFGCQMNELDSELVQGHLEALGYSFIDDITQANIVLYNTCSVREQAENKILSRVGRLGIEKKEGRNLILGIIGCMAEREGAGMLSKYPQIDFLCGPGELDKVPILLENAIKTGRSQPDNPPLRHALQGNTTRRSATLAAIGDNLEMLDLSRTFDPDRAAAGGRRAFVRITRGCNKFCTYCVVPQTRGPEIHRPPDAIVDECRRLADAGVIEITLLGQTVNHYRFTHGARVQISSIQGKQTPSSALPQGGREYESPQIGPGAAAFTNRNGKKSGGRVTTFADLLKRIHDEVPAIGRLRFVTSFPRDFSDDALAVMAESPRICNYLHVPVQSGSNRILKLMNRGYTAEEYLAFLDRARNFMPEVCIAGDFIVGFPTETDEDFEQTKILLHQSRPKNSFIFKYSPRPGTTAIDRYPDDIPEAVKRQRNNDLLAIQSEISASVHEEWVGRTVEVFVEGISKQARKHNQRVELAWEKPQMQLSGRTEGDLITVFQPPEKLRAELGNGAIDHLIGCIVPVRITGAGPLLLRGEAVPESLPLTISNAVNT